MNLLRIITPEEIGEMATRHNGGKFLSLTDLVNERIDHKVYRDFSSPDSVDVIHDAHNVASQAKILPFRKITNDDSVSLEETSVDKISENNLIEKAENPEAIIEHKNNENMSSFILIEKARLKKSQQSLKQKEIIDLYQKNSNVDVEQIKGSNTNLSQAREAGVLINKKHY
jgi:hypothetical protein